MKVLQLGRYALCSSVAAALLAGCGGSEPPISAPGVMPQSSAQHGALPFSQYLTSSGGEVQYVTEEYPQRIAEYDYPKGDAPIRHWALKGFPTAACTKGSKTFWIVLSKANEIVEFAVGREKPIKTLTVTGGEPFDCAINPASGDLAVPLAGTSGVVIFAKGSGSGQVFRDELASNRFSTYDSNGNLFVNGFYHGNPALAELPKKSAKFKLLSFSNHLSSELAAGPIRWDGTYVAMHDGVGNIDAIYRYRASGNVAKLEGTVTLEGATDCGWFWFLSQAGVLFCPDWNVQYVQVYKYPAGGSPIANLGPSRPYQAGIVSLEP